MTVRLMDGVQWVGVTDWGLRKFHGHELSTHRGSSYNSYLIVDELVVLVDTVWTPFVTEYMDALAQVIDPARIDYVVVNHAEVDHTGALPELMRHAVNAKVVVSRKGRHSVEGHYHEDWDFQVVGTGDSISIGQNSLTFIEAPMLHWPDTMFTYLSGKNILFSNDAFGQHYATEFLFNDRADPRELYEEALKYYVNIVNPFGPMVTKKVNEVLGMNLPVDMIAPSHGVIWRQDPLQIVHKYLEWARQMPEKRVAILYDTMWQATRKMADAIAEGLAERGVPHKLFHMAVTDRNDVLVEVFRARAVIVGSPTVNNGVLPTLTPILEDLRGLRFKNKLGAAFGSYGWSGDSVRCIEDHFRKCGFPVVCPGVLAKWQPRAEDLESCRELGRTVGQAVLQE